MLNMTYAEENGERPFILVRITPTTKPFEQTRMEMLGTFSRTELAELKKTIVNALKGH